MTLPHKHARISVVDDEYHVASTLALVLRMHGFEATFFTEPLQALHAARSDPPDLLLSEVSMTVLSGIELALELKKHCPDCKVLLFSGQPDSITLIEAGRATGLTFEILPKPIHPTDLLREIQNLFRPIQLPQSC
jgi:DNA-binding NtrC family response regulator